MRSRLAAFADEASPTIYGQIKAMQDNGKELLEIRGVDGENIADITKDIAREIRKRLDSAGIAVRSLGSPYGKTGVRDDFEPHLDNFRRSLETAEIDHPQVLE